MSRRILQAGFILGAFYLLVPQVPAQEVITALEQDPQSTPVVRYVETAQQRTNGVPGDWRGTSETGLSDVVRSHWVSLSAEGKLNGRISTLASSDGSLEPAAQLRVHFLQSGRIMTDVITDANGFFETAALAPGAYSVVATGPDGFLAFSVIVLPATPQQARAQADSEFVSLQPVEAVLSIDAVAVAPPFRILRSLMNQYFPEVRGVYVDEADFARLTEEQDEAGMPLPREGIRDLMDARPENTVPSTSIKHQSMRAGEDGRISGRILGVQEITGRPILVRQANVFIVQGDRIVARASTDDQGVFVVNGIEPGIYGLVIGAQEGFGAIGFEVVGGDIAQVADDDATFVSRTQDDLPPPPDGLSMAIITDPRDLATAMNAELPAGDAPVGDVAGAGGAGGGGSGGGGGGGGAGGGALGGLLGISAAGIGALSAALSGDDARGFDLAPVTP